MKSVARDLYIAAVDSKKVRIALFVFSVVMFVVAAGAPDAGTDFIR